MPTTPQFSVTVCCDMGRGQKVTISMLFLSERTDLIICTAWHLAAMAQMVIPIKTQKRKSSFPLPHHRLPTISFPAPNP